MSKIIYCEEPIDIFKEINNINDIYLIRIKCVCGTKINWIPYIEPIIENNILKIGNDFFPLRLIEEVNLRCKLSYGKEDITLKTSALYLVSLLNDKAAKELEKFWEKI